MKEPASSILYVVLNDVRDAATTRITPPSSSSMTRQVTAISLRADSCARVIPVAQAASGQQALSMMNVEKYDLVLLDIMMPELDGYAVLSTFKSEVRWRDSPVIMLSALDGARDIERCLERGAYDYLTKPYELNVLKARMWRCFHDQGLVRQVHGDEQPPRTLLIVDDEPLNRDLLLRRLEKFGHTAWAVGSGAEALHALDRREIDLVLLDIMIPHMDGFAVLTEIRARPALKDTVIIMISALGDGASLAR